MKSYFLDNCSYFLFIDGCLSSVFLFVYFESGYRRYRPWPVKSSRSKLNNSGLTLSTGHRRLCRQGQRVCRGAHRISVETGELYTPIGSATSFDTPAGAVHTVNWRSRYEGMDVSEARRLRRREEDDRRLKGLVAD